MLTDLRTLIRSQAAILNHYLTMAFFYGLFCGLASLLLIPIVTSLLQQEYANAGMYLAVLVAGTLFCHIWRIKVEKAGIQVGVTVLSEGRRAIGEHVSKLPIGWFHQEQAQKLNHVITHGIMEIAQLPAHVLTPMVSGAASLMAVVLGLLIVNWPVGLIALIAVPVLIAIALGSHKLSNQVNASFHQQSIETGNRVLEFAQTQAVIRAFNSEGASNRFLEQTFLAHGQHANKTIIATSISVLAHNWATQVIFLAMISLAVLGIQGNASPDVEDMSWAVLTFILMGRFIEPLLDMGGYSEVIRSGKHQLNTLTEILNTPVVTSANVEPNDISDHTIRFENVCFRYPNTEKLALNKVSFTAQHHTMTAIVGASGAGKSTILQLITRFYEPETGAISLQGKNLNNLPYDTLLQQISIIFQDGYLFKTSIRDNILLGNPNADEATLNNVIERAGLSHTIARLPNGLQTEVGEGGALLSGGERQRINIARALIKQAPILLVDEATASLDSENQAIISQTLAELKDRCTIIVIAHQLSTLTAADYIVVLDQGSIVEQGPQRELATAGGEFQSLLALGKAAQNWSIAPADESPSL